MWLFIVLAAALLILGFAGARGIVSHQVGLLSTGGFFFALACAILFGYRSRRVMLEDRERGSATTMLVMMAGMLKDQDDTALERIARAGGPAGEAAALLLERRRKS